MTEQELTALYAEVARPLLGWLVRRTPARDQAQDVFSETWARVVAKDRRIGRLPADERPAYVFAIARNLVLDLERRGRVELRAVQRLGLEALALGGAEDDVVLDDADAVLGLLDDPEVREVVRLRVLEDRDYDDIAARLAISPAAARQRTSRGLRRLRRRLEEGR